MIRKGYKMIRKDRNKHGGDIFYISYISHPDDCGVKQLHLLFNNLHKLLKLKNIEG